MTIFPAGTPIIEISCPEPGTPEFQAAEELRRANELAGFDNTAFGPAPGDDQIAAHPGSLGRPIPKSCFPSALAIVAGTMGAIFDPPAGPAPQADQLKPHAKRGDPA